MTLTLRSISRQSQILIQFVFSKEHVIQFTLPPSLIPSIFPDGNRKLTPVTVSYTLVLEFLSETLDKFLVAVPLNIEDNFPAREPVPAPPPPQPMPQPVPQAMPVPMAFQGIPENLNAPHRGPEPETLYYEPMYSAPLNPSHEEVPHKDVSPPPSYVEPLQPPAFVQPNYSFQAAPYAAYQNPFVDPNAVPGFPPVPAGYSFHQVPMEQPNPALSFQVPVGVASFPLPDGQPPQPIYYAPVPSSQYLDNQFDFSKQQHSMYPTLD